jgi:hypothetical protein
MSAPEENTTHTLLLAVLELTEKVSHAAAQAEIAATSVTGLRAETERRHQENTREIAKIHKGITAANGAVAKVAGDLKGVAAEVSEMKPIVTRQRRRDEFHDTLLDVLRTSWGKITAGIAALAAVILWFDGHWPKIMAFLRKFTGAILIMTVLAMIATAVAG